MRSFLALFLMLAALWQASSGNANHLAAATLAIGGAWFVSLFIAD